MLFCMTGEYKAETITKMRGSSETRDVMMSKFLEAAGCKLVAIYATVSHGPGAVVIFDAPDGVTAASVVAVSKSAGHVENVTATRLYTMQEILEVRKKSTEIAPHFDTP